MVYSGSLNIQRGRQEPNTQIQVYRKMASVSLADKDLRNSRMGKYNAQAVNEVRSWIELILGQRLPGNDLLDTLRDGVVLCKYDRH